MKPSRLFWGVLFVVLGGLLLAAKAFDFEIDAGILWKLWPLVFVLIGLSIIFKDQRIKWALAGVAAVVTALILFMVLSFSWFPWNGLIEIGDHDGEVQVQEFTEPMTPDVTSATLRMDAAIGKFRIESTSAHLLKANIQSTIGEHRFSRTGSGENTSMYLGLEGTEHRALNFKNAKNIVDVALHEGPVWELNLDVGAASADFDLSGLKVARLDLDAGASSVKLRLAEPQEDCRVKLNAGAASVLITIPARAACEVRFDGGLSSKQLENFEKMGDGLYRTANFNERGKKILIDADMGVSSFRVVRE